MPEVDFLFVEWLAAVIVITSALIGLYVFSSKQKEAVSFINRNMSRTNNALAPIAFSFFLLLLGNIFQMADYLGMKNQISAALEVISLYSMALGIWYFLYLFGMRRR